MNLKQAQTVLSDLLLKCEQENIALPQDPLESIIEAIQSLRSEIKHEMRRSQMDIALDHMRTKYGLRAGATPAHNAKSPTTVEKKRRHSVSGSEFAGHKPQDQHRYMRPIKTTNIAPAPHSSSTHSPAKKKLRLKDEVNAKPAVRPENQKLVNELLQLSEYELKTGRSQRGVTRLRAAKQVRDANEVIKSGAQARQLEGIGASAAGKVDLMLREGLKGALKEYEDGGDNEVEEEENEAEREDSEEDMAKAAARMEKQKQIPYGFSQTGARKIPGNSRAEQSARDNEGGEEEEEGDEGEDDEDDYREEDDEDDEDFYVPKRKK
ncbi:hypothetical protein Gpo141_00003856 [Globisporangium polare]